MKSKGYARFLDHSPILFMKLREPCYSDLCLGYLQRIMLCHLHTLKLYINCVRLFVVQIINCI